ncbi:hypothetical protein [Micromonospora arborensis]|uniref:hypothetical protein n=1 Tax=Micromonospora arborensis TaxID=2116518 RepID=UPI001FC9F7B3|nr:hypothetical protein [Micromonospora arborensis]
MTAAVIRYQTKPDAADENQRLIENIFVELAHTAPPGLRYSSFRLADGVTFVHVVDGNGLTELAAFQEFQHALGDRLAVGPARDDATLVGSYSPEVAPATTGQRNAPTTGRADSQTAPRSTRLNVVESEASPRNST